jgi:hypothetical protein
MLFSLRSGSSSGSDASGNYAGGSSQDQDAAAAVGLLSLSVDYRTDGPRSTPLRPGILPPPPPGGDRWRWLPGFDVGDGAAAGHNGFNRVLGGEFPDGRRRFMCYSHINPQWFKKHKATFERQEENYGRAISVRPLGLRIN